MGLARRNGRRVLSQRHAFSPLAKLENRHVTSHVRHVLRHFLGVHPTALVREGVRHGQRRSRWRPTRIVTDVVHVPENRRLSRRIQHAWLRRRHLTRVVDCSQRVVRESILFVFVVVFTNRRKGGYKNEVQILHLLYIRVLRRYDFNLHRVILKSWRSRRSTGVDVFSPDDGADDGVCRVDERRVKRDVEWW